MNKKYDVVYHLSDIDLDGYGSQYLMNMTDEDIVFFNTNISELNKSINDIFELILKNKDKKILFMITDLSFNEKTIKKFNNFKKGNSNIDLTYQLLDHHKSNGENVNEEWYLFDNNRCSARITADWILENYDFNVFKIDYIEYLGDFIDAHDRWLENSIYFHKSNFLSDKIFNIQFLDEMKNEKRDYIFYIIEKYTNFLKSGNIFDLESSSYNFDLIYLKDKIDFDLYKNINISLKLKYINYYAEFYLNKINIELLKFKNNFVLVFYNLDKEIFQYMSKIIMKNRKNIDFLMNISTSGSISFRSQKEIDVGNISKKYFNGGGHKNAGGAKININGIHSKKELYKYLIDKYGFEKTS